jgi:hypothetical protein
LLFKGELGAQFNCVTKLMSHNRCWLWFSQFTAATPLKLYILVDKFILQWSERRGRRLPGLIEERRMLTLVSPACRARERQELK